MPTDPLSVSGAHLLHSIIEPFHLRYPWLPDDSPNITTAETTNSATYVNLATTGPFVTVNVGHNGILICGLGALMTNDTSGKTDHMAPALSGANVRVADDDFAAALTWITGDFNRTYATFAITGLSPGPTVVTAQYRVSGGIGTFDNRHLWALAL